MTKPTNNDTAYEEWMHEQWLRSQPTQMQDKPNRVRESLPPYRSVEYEPPKPEYTPEPSHRRYKKLQRRRYPDWRQVLGWTCVLGSTIVTFNLMLHGIKSVCPVQTQSAPKSSTQIESQIFPLIYIPTMP